MTEKEKMIPLSVIDAKIAEFEKSIKELSPEKRNTEIHRVYDVLIITLEDLKKEAISFPIYSIMEPSLEQKIKDSISQLEEHHEHIVTGNDCVEYALFELRKLIAKPPFTVKTPLDLEQKIKDRIKELEAEYDRSAAYAIDNHEIRMGYQIAIDELRKLLE